MEKQIRLQNKKVAYTIRQSRRARRMRLEVNCDGSVVATMPLYFPQTAVERFVEKHTSWILKKVKYFSQFAGQPMAHRGKRDYLKYKEEARALAKARTAFFNRFYGFKVNKINVKNQRSRWGSCSRAGNLNFNYKILFLPADLQDYIIIHELCHLKELNHSRRFWRLVAQSFPHWRAAKEELKKNALNFH